MNKKFLKMLCLTTFICGSLYPAIGQCPDSIMYKTTKGIVFIPAFNPEYDDHRKLGSEIIPLYYDYFFAGSNNAEILLNNIEGNNIMLNNGMKATLSSELRNIIKKKSKIIFSKPIDYCYWLNSFYLTSIKITYSESIDKDPKMCTQDNFKLMVNNTDTITFNLSNKIIKIIKIEVE
jgi:hypothetical protein